MAISPTAGEIVMVLALARSAQRWVGSRHPANVLTQDQDHLFEPLDSPEPAGAHLLGELRRAGYLLGLGWLHRQPACDDITVLEAAGKMRGRKLTELQEWRRGHGVLWFGEMLRADGRTPRRRHATALRAASGDGESRLRRILFGPGRSEAGPARRVGLATLEAWTIIRVDDWIWRESVFFRVCSVGSGSVGARGSPRCEEATAGQIGFIPELIDVATNVAPLLIDTATVTEDGLYSLDLVEHAMLEGVVRDSDSRGEASAQNSRRTDTGSSASVSDTIEPDEATRSYVGCRDAESLVPLHQILPYGSQYRDTTSSAGHAWVNADIREDEQVRRAVEQVEATIRRHTGTQPLVLSAYSDSSVTGRGVAGSAAIVIETADGEVVATVRRAPTDMALSSGRTE